MAQPIPLKLVQSTESEPSGAIPVTIQGMPTPAQDGAVGSRIHFDSSTTKTAGVWIDVGTFKVRFLSGSGNAPYPTLYAASGTRTVDVGSISIGIPAGTILSLSLKSVSQQVITDSEGYNIMDSGAYGTGMFRDSFNGEAWTIATLAPPTSRDSTPSGFSVVFERVA